MNINLTFAVVYAVAFVVTALLSLSATAVVAVFSLLFFAIVVADAAR